MPVQCGNKCQALEVPPSTSSSRIEAIDAAPAKYKSTTDDGSGPPNASFVVAVRDDVEAVRINGTLDDEDLKMIAESWRTHANLLMIFVRRDDCFYTPFPLSREMNSPRSLKDVFGRVPCLQRSSPRNFCNLTGPFAHSRKVPGSTSSHAFSDSWETRIHVNPARPRRYRRLTALVDSRKYRRCRCPR
jgi:hypothetical protein